MRSSPTGISMIEIIVTIALISVLFVVTFDFVIKSLDVQRYVGDQNDAIGESRKALGTMVEELREAVAGDDGSYPLDTIEEQELIFYSDVDNDATTERIRYVLDETDLQRGVTEPSGDSLSYDDDDEVLSVLASSIRNDTEPIFSYYDENYPEDSTNNPLEHPIDQSVVRMVQINLFVNIDPNRLPESRELEVFVHLRNLKENF